MPDLGGFELGRATWAILLSVAFWLLVQTELNPERSDVFDLAVESTNVPAGLIVVNQADSHSGTAPRWSARCACRKVVWRASSASLREPRLC